MYNGGIFGGAPTGSLGVGVPSGWGNVDDTEEKKDKEPLKKESDQMRNNFLGWFPKTNKSKFPFAEKGVSWGGKRIFSSGMPKNTSMNNDLGISPSFPPQLQSSTRQTYSFPKSSTGGVKSEVTIYHSQRESTVVRFRDVFKNQQIKFTSASECKKWQTGPNWKYWPQKLNLATWCATGGCGVTVDWNEFPPEVRNLLKFHVIFTVRRLLYEMDCALPDDTGFDQINNPHNLAGIERIRREFNAPSDFRNKRGSNGGLGDINAQFFHSGRKSKVINLKSATWSNSWPQHLFRFRDEGLSDSNIDRVIQYTMNPEPHQEGWFMLRKSYGLTMAGKGRLNRSIEAFVYCVLGAQVNMRSSITGQSGSAQEVKQELINLFEKAIIEEEHSVSAQRYQTAIQSSRAKLDFALAPGLWLLPSDLEMNLTRKVGYNNFLQKATEHMKLGVNDVNARGASSLQGALRLPPTRDDTSHDGTAIVAGDEQKKIASPRPVVAEAHQDNLATIAIVAAGAAWWVLR